MATTSQQPYHKPPVQTGRLARREEPEQEEPELEVSRSSEEHEGDVASVRIEEQVVASDDAEEQTALRKRKEEEAALRKRNEEEAALRERKEEEAALRMRKEEEQEAAALQKCKEEEAELERLKREQMALQRRMEEKAVVQTPAARGVSFEDSAPIPQQQDDDAKDYDYPPTRSTALHQPQQQLVREAVPREDEPEVPQVDQQGTGYEQALQIAKALFDYTAG